MRSAVWRVRLLTTVALIGVLPASWAAADSDDISWYQARSEGTVTAYQQYLDAYPAGRYSSDAFACIVGMTQVPELASRCAADTSIEPASGPEVGSDSLNADPY